MNNFVIEKYLLYVKNIKDNNTEIYIVEKRNVTGVAMRRISEGKKENISLYDIKSEFVKGKVNEIKQKVSFANIKYAVKYLSALFRTQELDIVKYGNVKEYENISDGKYNIRIVRYYYDPKGRLYQGIFNKKW